MWFRTPALLNRFIGPSQSGFSADTRMSDDDDGAAAILAAVSEAVVVEQAAVVTDVKIKSLQEALRWLVAHHQTNKDKLAAASEDRAALVARLEVLEKAAVASADQSASGLGELASRLTALESGLEAMNEELGAKLEANREAHTQLLEKVDALEPQLAEAQAQAAVANEQCAALHETVEQLGEQVERTRAEGKVAAEEMRGALAALTAERLGPVEEMARSTRQRLDSVENSIDLRFLELGQQMDEKIEAASGAWHTAHMHMP